jgi:hypothetical protein
MIYRFSDYYPVSYESCNSRKAWYNGATKVIVAVAIGFVLGLFF